MIKKTLITRSANGLPDQWVPLIRSADDWPDLWGADRWGPDLGPGHEWRSGGRSTHIPWGRTCYTGGVQNYLPTVCFSTFPQYPKVLPGLCFMLVSRGFPVCWIPEPLDCRIPGSPRHYCFTLCVYVAVVRCSAIK